MLCKEHYRISIASGFLVLMRKKDLNPLHVVDHFRKSPFFKKTISGVHKGRARHRVIIILYALILPFSFHFKRLPAYYNVFF